MCCLVGYFKPYPDNAIEVRYEAVRREILPEEGYDHLLLVGLQWAVHFLARNDPFVMLNVGGARRIDVQLFLDLEPTHNVWCMPYLETMHYKHIEDKDGQRLMELSVQFQ